MQKTTKRRRAFQFKNRTYIGLCWHYGRREWVAEIFYRNEYIHQVFAASPRQAIRKLRVEVWTNRSPSFRNTLERLSQ